MIKFMTYNVWSREDVVVYKRMQAIGGLVQKHEPDVIFFQEITPYIHRIFQTFAWWNDYYCSPVSPEEQTESHHFCLMLSKLPLENFARWRFTNTPTGRGYLEAVINPGSTTTKPILVATTQLESPNPPASMYCMERYQQAEHAVAALSRADNVVLGGDMSWDDSTDMPFPLPPGWVDAWTKLRPHKDGWTYDGIWNEKVGEFSGYVAPHSSLKKRSDRFVCKLQDYLLNNIGLIASSVMEFRYHKGHKGQSFENNYIDLRPSCHHGVVLTIVPKPE